MAGQLVLITGAVRSGKSRYAEQMVRELAGPGGVVYLATSRVWDDEMAARVAQHQRSRPAVWQTVEEPLRLGAALEGAGRARRAAVLVESVDMWVSNRLMEIHPVEGEDTTRLDPAKVQALEAALLKETTEIVAAHRASNGDLVLVTVEAGWGVVPPYPLGRVFRDLLGRVNTALAAEAGRVLLMVAGLPVDVKRLGGASGD